MYQEWYKWDENAFKQINFPTNELPFQTKIGGYNTQTVGDTIGVA